MPIIEVLTQKGKLVDDFLLETLRLDASNELYEIAKHQVAAGGKRLRPAMTILCCESVGGSAEDAIPAAAGIELVHNYTLIFDDIIDRSDLRRGLPTVGAKYGDVMAILAGMHYREAIFEATRRCSKPMKVEEILSSALRRIIEGERLDVLFEQAGREAEYVKKKRRKSIGEKDYFGMIGKKTAVLFEAACKVGGLVGNGTPSQVDALSEFGWNCGIAFQIIDDVLDIAGKKEEFGKDIGKDISEHKLGNLVILYSLEELSEFERRELLEILRSPAIDDAKVDKATNIVFSTGAIERAHETSSSFATCAKSSLDLLPYSEAKNVLLSMADFIIKRSF